MSYTEIRERFAHLHWRPMPHSFGVDVASDWADRPDGDEQFGLYKNCGFWTMDEARLLVESASQFGGEALDIGSHTGWTMAHLLKSGCNVEGVDPMYRVPEFLQRAKDNLTALQPHGWEMYAGTSLEYFADVEPERMFDVICIDGDHSVGKPLEDAINAEKHLKPRGLILLHDAVGGPVHEAVEYLTARRFLCKAYPTVHGLAICWRGEFTPPQYGRIPDVVAAVWDRLGPLRRFAG